VNIVRTVRATLKVPICRYFSRAVLSLLSPASAITTRVDRALPQGGYGRHYRDLRVGGLL
jgi:hypothetical protein